LLAEEVLTGRLTLNDWDEGLEQWVLRLNLLSQWCPELALPPISEEERRHLVEQVCHGSFNGKDLKEKPAKGVVKSWLSSAQQGLLDKHAPERLTLSNGRTAKVIYEVGNHPYIALRIQQLYGVKTTPGIAMGRVPILVHILAPSQRPVQITQDMAGFWRDHYPGIKQQLQRKYPRHEWR
jgi:ATP-dependent helicase HrpB